MNFIGRRRKSIYGRSSIKIVSFINMACTVVKFVLLAVIIAKLVSVLK
jgi:hypothetical protein